MANGQGLSQSRRCEAPVKPRRTAQGLVLFGNLPSGLVSTWKRGGSLRSQTAQSSRPDAAYLALCISSIEPSLTFYDRPVTRLWRPAGRSARGLGGGCRALPTLPDPTLHTQLAQSKVFL